MASETKLLSCPWCGVAPQTHNDGSPPAASRIRCDNIACMVNPEAWGDTPEDVDRYWNTRTPPPADAGREALITALGEIATYPRPYSRTPPYHMADTIENMRAIARAALAREGTT